jgi:hypothetical protein
MAAGTYLVSQLQRVWLDEDGDLDLKHGGHFDF